VRNLHTKLVLILVVLVLSVMAVTGIFLINSVTSYQINDFKAQMGRVFTTEFIDTLGKNARESGDAEQIKTMISAYSGTLGIDSNRSFSILDRKTGAYLAGSDDVMGRELEKTPNIISAMSGRVGDHAGFTETYMDLAIPIGGEDGFVVAVRDNKQRIRDLTWVLFAVTLQAMLFGLVVAVFLSFFLSKTMTTPIEELTKGAARLKSGQSFDRLEVHSSDEIGVLTETFNDMAQTLRETIAEAEGERNKLNTLFLHMADGVAAFVTGGTLLHMNPAAERMLGIRFSPELRFPDVFPGMRSPNLEDQVRDGYLESDYNRGGRDFKIYFATFGLPDGESGLMAVIHDITEQSRMETARREFVANVSHELRTPLTNIRSYAETLADGGEAIPLDTRTSFLTVILNEADRMTRIVSDLLTLSRLDCGRLELSIQRFAVGELLQKIYDAMAMTAKNAGCRLSLSVAPDLPPLPGDRERVEQVVVNVLSNAVKYTPRGGSVDLQASKIGGDLVITVTDTGIGIPEKDLPRLFDRFYRVDKARSREQGGTGLGLSIAKEIVEQHRGSISVASKLDQGTRVTITLPFGLVAENEQ